MFKKFIISFLTSLSCLTSMFAANIKMPEEMTIKEHYVSFTSTFDIETEAFNLGFVKRKFLSLKLEYDFYDFDNELKAKGRLRWLSLGAVFDVTDAAGSPIGLVKEHFFTFFPTYEIISASGKKLAVASLNFWGTRYTFKDPENKKEIAVLSRPFFRFFTDYWTLKVHDNEFFNRAENDPYLFILISVFQTDRDYWNSGSDHLMFKSFSRIMPLDEHELHVEVLRQEIDAYRQRLAKAEPTEEDFNRVDALIETLFLDEEESSYSSKQHSALIGLNKIMPLLDDATITPEQKYVLFLLIEEKLKELELNIL